MKGWVDLLMFLLSFLMFSIVIPGLAYAIHKNSRDETKGILMPTEKEGKYEVIFPERKETKIEDFFG